MKTLIIDAISGVGFPTISIALEAERKQMAEYTGHRHEWRRKKLAKMTLEDLQDLYENLREARANENGVPPDESLTPVAENVKVAYAH